MAKQLEQRMRRVYEEMALNKIIGKQQSCYTRVVNTLLYFTLPPLSASPYSSCLPLLCLSAVPLLCLPPPTLSAPFTFLCLLPIFSASLYTPYFPLYSFCLFLLTLPPPISMTPAILFLPPPTPSASPILCRTSPTLFASPYSLFFPLVSLPPHTFSASPTLSAFPYTLSASPNLPPLHFLCHPLVSLPPPILHVFPHSPILFLPPPTLFASP